MRPKTPGIRQNPSMSSDDDDDGDALARELEDLKKFKELADLYGEGPGDAWYDKRLKGIKGEYAAKAKGGARARKKRDVFEWVYLRNHGEVKAKDFADARTKAKVGYAGSDKACRSGKCNFKLKNLTDCRFQRFRAVHNGEHCTIRCVEVGPGKYVFEKGRLAGAQGDFGPDKDDDDEEEDDEGPPDKPAKPLPPLPPAAKKGGKKVKEKKRKDPPPEEEEEDVPAPSPKPASVPSRSSGRPKRVRQQAA